VAKIVMEDPHYDAVSDILYIPGTYKKGEDFIHINFYDFTENGYLKLEPKPPPATE